MSSSSSSSSSSTVCASQRKKYDDVQKFRILHCFIIYKLVVKIYILLI